MSRKANDRLRKSQEKQQDGMEHILTVSKVATSGLREQAPIFFGLLIV